MQKRIPMQNPPDFRAVLPKLETVPVQSGAGSSKKDPKTRPLPAQKQPNCKFGAPEPARQMHLL
jgi:hypothetical protein